MFFPVNLLASTGETKLNTTKSTNTKHTQNAKHRLNENEKAT